MTTQQLNETGYIVVDNEVLLTTYRDYLDEYGTDKTTSPRGVESRLHIREKEDNEGNVTYELWTWGVGGNNPRFLESFENEEDVVSGIYDARENYVNEKNWDAPIFWDTEKRAIEDLAEKLEKPIEIVTRYLSIKAIRDRKAIEHRAAITRQREARKAWLAVEVPKEAATFTIDNEFREAVKSASMASAMKGLLERNGKEKIETDFWQVARILKSKVS